MRTISPQAVVLLLKMLMTPLKLMLVEHNDFLLFLDFSINILHLTPLLAITPLGYWAGKGGEGWGVIATNLKDFQL